MCFGLDIFGLNKGRKEQAKAMQEEARQNRLLAQSSQQNFENQIAQQKASEMATQALSKPIEETSVTLGETVDRMPGGGVSTGRRKTSRSQFQMIRSKGGLGGL